MQAGLRAWINLANGSTLAGLGVAALGGARVARSADRLFAGTGYRLPVPPAPAPVPSWAEVIVADDPPGLNGHNPEDA